MSPAAGSLDARQAKAAVRIAIAIPVAALLLLHAYRPILVTPAPVLNALVVLAALCAVPVMIAIEFAAIGRVWSILACIALILAAAAIALVAVVVMWFHAATVTGTVAWRSSQIRAYTVYAWNSADSRVSIRQERPVFPGLLLVRRIDAFDACTGVTLRVEGDRLLVTVPAVGLHVYPLKPFVYF